MKKVLKKIKITILDFDDIKNPLLGAGQAGATYQVGSRLAKMNYQITSVCSRYPNYQDRFENGIYYKHIGLGSKYIRLNNLFYFLAVPLFLIGHKTDLIVECFTAPFSTLFSPLFTKSPVVVLPSMFNAKEFAQKYKLPFYLVENFGLRFYKFMMPYSETDSAKAKKLNPNLRIKVVPQGVSEDYFLVKKSKPKHILFLSRFDIAQKGIDLLLASYAKVQESIGYPLVIAGHGPDEAKIRKIIFDLKLEKKVTLVGSAYGDKKNKLMSEAIFVAFPSRHDEMCLWVLEALAAGLPIVGFDIPESKWLKKSISLKAKPFDIDEYSKLLVRGTNLHLNKQMSVMSRKIAKQFSWENVVDEYNSFFKNILKKEVFIRDVETN